MPRQLYSRNTLVTIYDYDDDGLYLGMRQKIVKQGTSIPAKSTIIPPGPDQRGFLRVFDEESETWDRIPDIRGRTIYDVNTKEKRIAKGRTQLREGETLEKFETDEDVWNGSEWVTPRHALVDILNDHVIKYIESTAITEGFTSFLDAVSYAEEPTDPGRQAKGRALRAWRSACWLVVDEQLQNDQLPNLNQLIALLPNYNDF